MKRLFAFCLVMSLGFTGTFLSGCGGSGDNGPREPENDMPAGEDLTEDPTAETAEDDNP